MRALITGVNGFVGGYLSDYLLNKGMEVWGTKLTDEIKSDMLDEKIEIRDVDITDYKHTFKVIDECKPDYIYHLAAQSSVSVSWKKPQLTMEVNIKGTLNLLETVKNLNMRPRILLIGTSEEYGITKPEDIPIRETNSIKPCNPYAVSKVAQEMLAEQYVKTYNMDIIMVRAFNHIGARQSEVFVASDFAKRIAMIENGFMEPVLKVGNLEAKRDFTDVRDIVKAYYELSQKGKSGQLYNVGSGNCYKIQNILDILLNMSNTKIRIENDLNRMRPSDIPIVQCDNSKITNTIGWTPKIGIRETLFDLLNYWRKTIEKRYDSENSIGT